jgi:hypothetical protein
MNWVQEQAGIDGSGIVHQPGETLLSYPTHLLFSTYSFVWFSSYAELTVSIVYRRLMHDSCAVSIVGKTLYEYSVEECVQRDGNSG